MRKALSTALLGTLCVLTGAMAPAAAAEGKSQPRVVLVGIDEYQDKQIKARPHAEADAKSLYDVFTSKDYLGVDAADVHLLLGKADPKRNSQPATRENVIKALHWAGQAGRDDQVVIGLFVQGAPKGERACYLTTDSTFKDRATNAVAAAEVEHELEKMKSVHVTVFLDVNFKGFDLGKDKAPEVHLQNLYKEFLGKEEGENGSKPGRIIFLANTGLNPSLEEKDHGLFAEILLKGLKGDADKEGYEPDGLVTVDELIEYFDKEAPSQVRKIGKTKEEKEQLPHILGGRECHFVVTHNPAVMTKVKERLEKLTKLAADGKISHELSDEGHALLSRMPKLEAQRKLRKDYQKLVDGTTTVADFTADRKKILDGMKYSRTDALDFAAKVIQASQFLHEEYVKEVNQGDLIGWVVEGLYKGIGEKIPKDVKDRLAKVKDMKEGELTKLLADVRERLGNREDLDKHKDIDLALQMMTRKLDPYTTYIDPETLERFRQDTEANFTGIGIQIRKDTDDMLTVVTPIKDSPAYKAGVKAGDVVIKITRAMDSKGKAIDPPEVISTKGLRIDEAVKKILGQPDTKVKLTVERKGESKPLEFEITRGLVEVETVLGVRRKDDDNWDFWVDHKNKIAYVRLTSFAKNTWADLLRVLQKLDKKMADDKDSQIKGMVLDLRFNPGGLLPSAIQISDLFIDDGAIVSIRPRIGKERSFNGEHDGSFLNFPMVCLINGSSASASEIVSACLQDHHRAIIVGARSYGKGSVQNIQNFEGGQLKLTTASYWRPSGKNINKSSTGGKEEDEWGVTPDKGFRIKMTDKERDDLAEAQHASEIIRSGNPDVTDKKAPFKDRQLEAALEYLRGQLKIANKVATKKESAER